MCKSCYGEQFQDSTRKSKARAVRNNEFIRGIKEGKPCVDCGGYFPFYAMDFDHITADKAGNIARMSWRGDSREKLLAEISKCELVCSNCHRGRTWRRLAHKKASRA